MIERDFLYGMHMLGIPPEDALSISREFSKKKFPKKVLDTIVKNRERVENLHSDKWPWHPSTFDELAGGFAGVINTDKVWEDALKYFNDNQKSVPLTSIDTEGTCGAIANLLEIYALAKYHDLKELDKKREVVY